MVSYTLLSSGGSRAACTATLLDFDGEVRVLADPSWDGSDTESVLFLEKTLGSVDLVVLSHSTPEFAGAYVLLCAKFPVLMRAIPVYATVAVAQLARVATVEFYRARGVLGPVSLANLEVSDVDEWFDRVLPLKFAQNMPVLENKLVLTAHAAGHTLGGAFWVFVRRTEKVVYAPAWNHARDSFLNSAGFLSPATSAPLLLLVRPTTLICGGSLGSQMGHKLRTEKLLNLVNATLANGGAVLLPVAVSGRFFELLRVIDTHLASLAGAAVPVYFLSYSGTKVLSYAENLADWMLAQLVREYARNADTGAPGDLPFEPAKVDLLADPIELAQRPGPKIVFASGVDLDPGDASAAALRLLCQDEKSTLILTEKSPFAGSDTLAAALYEEWHRLAAQKNGGVAEDGIPVPLQRSVPLDVWTIEEPLSGSALAQFKEKVGAARRQKLLEKVRDKKNENILNAEDDDESSDGNESSDDERGDIGGVGAGAGAVPGASVDSGTGAGAGVGGESGEAKTEAAAGASDMDALKTHEMFVGEYIAESLKNYKPVDIRISARMKPKQAMFPMPLVNKKRKFDDYGEVIDAKDFQGADDNSANNKLISESKRKFELNDKGKWGQHDDRRRGRRGYGSGYGHDRDDNGHGSGYGSGHGQGGDKKEYKNRLTPQEALNNEVLQKYLDALFRPVRRVLLRDIETASGALRLNLRCGLSFVDLAGLVDVRSLVMIVAALRPQNLVVLPDASYSEQFEAQLDGQMQLKVAFEKQKSEQNSKRDSGAFAASRFGALTAGVRGVPKSYNSGMEVYTPGPNAPAQIGSDGSGRLREFEVKLDEALDKSLKWQKLAGNYRIAKVEGELGVFESQLLVKREHASAAIASQFVLQPVTENTRHATHEKALKLEDGALPAGTPSGGFGSSLAIGNVRLPELKKKLMALDLDAVFKGEGVLVVNDEVAIRKVSIGAYQGEDTGDLVIDGQIGALYYQVKDCIKEMLAFV